MPGPYRTHCRGHACVARRRLTGCIMLLNFLLLAGALSQGAPGPVHVWEKQELTFTSATAYANPYTDVIVWVDLTGPGFKKRVYGFWDGGQTFRVRVRGDRAGRLEMAQADRRRRTRAWRARPGRSPPIAWTEEEKQQNPLRRGFLRATRQPARPGTGRRHAVLRHRRHLVFRRHQPLHAGTTTTRSAPWARRPVSRTTSATARRRATTGSTSSRPFPTG